MNGQEISPWAILPHLIPGLKAHAARIFGATACMIGGVVLRLVEPWPLQIVLDHVLAGLPAPAVLNDWAVWGAAQLHTSGPIVTLTACAVGLIVIAVIRAGVDYYRTVAFTLIGNAIISDLRGQLFRHLQTLSLDFHSRTRSGDLTVRLTSDVSMLKDVTVSAALPLLSSGLLLCGMLGVMLWMNWQLGLIILAVFPIFAIMTYGSSRKIHLSARRQRKREGALASTAAENLAAVKSLQAQGGSVASADNFSSENEKSHKEGARTSRLMAGLERSVDVQIAIVTAIVLWLGTQSVLNGALTAGELVVYLAYLKRGFRPLQDFAKYTGRISKAIAAGERITELLREKPDIVDSPGAVAAPKIRGSISFENVCFAYKRTNSAAGTVYMRQVMDNLNLRVEAGQSVAIVGPSGVGKSTLLSLLLRLREPGSGCIRIDGTDIRNWTIDSLRQQMTVILQENSIFATTIRENIAMFCPSATLEEIEAAAETASAHKFIMQLAEGYDTLVGERGVDLSQGQLQRLAIARAALRNVPILLLDEPTSNLDAENRQHVMTALRRVAANRTTLIITHDLDLAQQCDRVLYLGPQQTVAFSTPERLYQECRSYAELVGASNRRLSMPCCHSELPHERS